MADIHVYGCNARHLLGTPCGMSFLERLRSQAELDPLARMSRSRRMFAATLEIAPLPALAGVLLLTAITGVDVFAIAGVLLLFVAGLGWFSLGKSEIGLIVVGGRLGASFVLGFIAYASHHAMPTAIAWLLVLSMFAVFLVTPIVSAAAILTYPWSRWLGVRSTGDARGN